MNPVDACPASVLSARNSHPSLLEEIVSMPPARQLTPKESQQRRAQGLDKRSRRFGVGLLYRSIQRFGCGSRECHAFLKSNAHLWVICEILG